MSKGQRGGPQLLSLQLCAQDADKECPGEGRAAPGEGGAKTTGTLPSLVEALPARLPWAFLGIPASPASPAGPGCPQAT